MFEKLARRVQAQAESKAKERTLELTERVRAELPRGIKAEATPEGIRLSGRGLKRRFVLDPALRWLLAGLR
jgi:hypothetical protein